MKKKNTNYVDCVATCACGATFNTKSTKEKIHVEICSECHPFYTGQNQKSSLRKGKVEQFNKKYGFNE
jgi:large subunit ribosomal protein L31